MDTINIINAFENNLKNVCLKIPKKQITVFTGVSGSGKSSLCLDTIAAESRRELNETFPSFVQQFLPKYGRPDVGRIENLPVTIVVDQKKPAPNTRSTVGTYTDIYSLLRLLFSRVGHPFIGYSDSFSFNHPSGKCPRCDGLGEVHDLDIHKLVDFSKSLNDEDTIHFPTFGRGLWRWKRYAWSGLFDLDKKIKDYSKEELDLFLYSPQIKLKNPPSYWPKSAKYEGIFPRMYRSIITTKEGKRFQHILDKMVSTFECPECLGSRVNEKVRSCRINGKNIAEVTMMQIPDAIEFVKSITDPLAIDMKRELAKRLGALMEMELGSLFLNRGTNTLSGGELQRVKLASNLNRIGTIFVLDEPTDGLHLYDIRTLMKLWQEMTDAGNTLFLVEHSVDVMKDADWIIELGPGGGISGGEILYTGEPRGILTCERSVTRPYIIESLPK